VLCACVVSECVREISQTHVLVFACICGAGHKQGWDPRQSKTVELLAGGRSDTHTAKQWCPLLSPHVWWLTIAPLQIHGLPHQRAFHRQAQQHVKRRPRLRMRQQDKNSGDRDGREINKVTALVKAEQCSSQIEAAWQLRTSVVGAIGIASHWGRSPWHALTTQQQHGGLGGNDPLGDVPHCGAQKQAHCPSRSLVCANFRGECFVSSVWVCSQPGHHRFCDSLVACLLVGVLVQRFVGMLHQLPVLINQFMYAE
jgi:hypothetical protein